MANRCCGKTSLDVAELDSLFQRSQRVPFWNELLADKPFIAGGGNGFHHGGVVKLLSFVDLISAWVAAGMVVTDILMVLLDCANHVTFHDLHMINIVEELEPIGANAFADLNAPGSVVGHIIFVVHFAVE